MNNVTLRKTPNKLLKVCFIAFSLWSLSACSNIKHQRHGAASYTIISDQNDKMREHYTPIGGKIEDKDCLKHIGPINYGKFPLAEETLLARVLEEHNADALINAEVKSSMSLFSTCVIISGTPVKLGGTP
ncbi:MAG: hypothetical protein LBB56_02445 [Chitinispirillales bacterium]|jgi:hypothetical protein|nr:hypothetical protein [Chitinispirillales bacterium]